MMMVFLAVKLHQRRIKASSFRLPTAIPAVVFVLMGVAQAASPCTSQATAPPEITQTVTCSEAAITQFFLESPAMASIAADQRAVVASHPLRYALAYMGADAANQLQQGFLDHAVKQISYKGILITSDAKNAALPHKMFALHMDRALAARTDWKTLEPDTLFKLSSAHLSHWLQTGIAAENAKSEPASALPPKDKAPAATNQPHPAGPSPSAAGASTGK
jgi:hypothetical protein